MSVKGFSPRERNGLIALAIVVIICFCLGYIADILGGCTRAGDDSSARIGSSEIMLDSTRRQTEEDSKRDEKGADEAGDTLRVSGRNKSRHYSHKKSSRKHSGNSRSSGSAAPSRRSFRDEPISPAD